MRAQIIKIDPADIDIEVLEKAAAMIKRGGLVSFPTETVYGLGANALDPEAAAGIFKAKRRPFDDPLIVHISENTCLDRIVKHLPDAAIELTKTFWPGPLTIIADKSEIVPDIVTTGLGTVALRMPSHPIALKLIELSDVPVAAPSANIFGRISPTCAEHVIGDLGNEIDIIVDGGKSEIGLESTIVTFEEDKAVILRPGGVTLEDIRKIIKRVDVAPGGFLNLKYPGKYPSHYSPYAEVIVIEKSVSQGGEIRKIAEELENKEQKFGIMCLKENVEKYEGYDVKELGPGNDLKKCAAGLFSILREFDSGGYEFIIVEGIPEEGLGLAIMNRLRKAAGK